MFQLVAGMSDYKEKTTMHLSFRYLEYRETVGEALPRNTGQQEQPPFLGHLVSGRPCLENQHPLISNSPQLCQEAGHA